MNRADLERPTTPPRGALLGGGATEHDARRRLAFLTEVSTLLGQSLDVDETLQRLADLAVPSLADWCTIDVLEEGQLRLAAAAHVDPDKAGLVWQLWDHYGATDGHGPGKVVRTAEPELLTHVTDELFAFLAHTDEHLNLMRALQPVSAVAVPLIARGRLLGAVTLVQARSEGRYVEGDLPLLQEVAHRAAFSIDNAALYAERDRTARMLQQALLPPSLPEPDGLDVAARYETADSVEIGGDFYDAIDTLEGCLVVVGDVCGKGAEAASLSSVARHTVHAAAMQHSDPDYVLRMLNEALVRDTPDESFCTATCAHVHTNDHRAELMVASGGHPPPLVRRNDGTVESLDADGMAVGLFEDPRSAATVVMLDPGDLLLVYTDGLSEARRNGELLGIDGIAAVLGDTVGLDAEATLAILQATADAQYTRQRDDMALLAVHVRSA